jgi:DNA polymerase I
MSKPKSPEDLIGHLEPPLSGFIPEKTLVLDGDILCYVVASVCEDTTEWEENFVTRIMDIHSAKRELTRRINNILKNVQSAIPEIDQIIFALSCPSKENYRLGIDPGYKGNRVGAQKPVGLGTVRKHDFISGCMPEGSLVLEVPTLEADDILGILMGEGYVALSDDKDIKTCPGTLGYITATYDGDHAITKRSAKSSNFYLLCQTLSGDSTDGIPGLPGVGTKTAEKAVIKAKGTPEVAPWQFVVSQYESKGMTEEDAETTFRLVYILRDTEDYPKADPKKILDSWDNILVPKEGATRQRKAKDRT